MIRLLIAPCITHDVDQCRAGKERQPFDDGAGEEVGFVDFRDRVAASARGFVL